ncbi:MAG: hypothetical protein AAF745_10110 [Planctomycetota bacterium]
MTDPAFPSDPLSDDDRLDDAWLDTLLCERFGDENPPDLSDQILAEFYAASSKPVTTYETKSTESSIADEQQPSVVSRHVNTVPRRSVRQLTHRRDSRQKLGLMAAITAIAASTVIAMAWFRKSDPAPTRFSIDRGTELASANEAPSPMSSTASERTADRASEDLQQLQGISLLAKKTRSNPSTAPRVDSSEAQRDDSSPTPTGLTLVANQNRKSLRDYWNRLDLEPTSKLPADTLVDDIKDRFEIQITKESLRDLEQLVGELRQSENQAAILRQVWGAIQSPADQTKRDADSGQRIAAMTQALTENSFDSWLVSSVTKDVAEKLDHHELTRAAALLRNRDLRCSRCHDDHIDRDPDEAQTNYWSFAATLREAAGNTNAVFYELPDGRRKLASAAATPVISDAVDNVNLSVSRQTLAQGLVDQLWHHVIGRPLSHRRFDWNHSPVDTRLTTIRNRLAMDLVAHQFDVTRTFAMILSSDAFGRSQPKSFRDDIDLTSDDVLLADAIRVDAMAAGRPTVVRLDRGPRLALIRRSVLSVPTPSQSLPSLDDSSVLAQIAGNQSGRVNATSKAKTSIVPERVIGELPTWIADLESARQRDQHVGYLSGRLDVPKAVQQLVDEMRRNGVEEAIVLQRLSWML